MALTRARVRAVIAVCAAAAFTVWSSGFVAAAAKAPAEAPIPRFSYSIDVSTPPHRHEQRFLLKSIEVYGVPHQMVRINCDDCLRLATKPYRITATHGAERVSGANWILSPGRAVSIRIYEPGEVGRYLLLRARLGAHPALVVKERGCLFSPLQNVACPAGTPNPPINKPIVNNPLPPTTQTNQPTTPTSYPLSVSVGGSGSGSVEGAGISCPGTCSQTYATGTSVTITATPNPGSTFAGWSGACNGTDPCDVTIGAAASVTATFVTYPALSVTPAGAGSGAVSGSGIYCPGDCSQSYPTGTVVSLTAAPAVGSAFTGWSGACSGTATCNVTMTGNQAVTATFALSPPALVVYLAGPGAGTVTTPNFNCASPAADCGAGYPAGSVVTMTAAPAAGSTFSGWSGACTGTGTCTVTINRGVSVTATFTR